MVSNYDYSGETSFIGMEKEIFVRQWLLDNPKAVILIVHGFAEHSGRYTEVANYFLDKAYSVLALDLKGHGRSKGERGLIRNIDEYHQNIELLYQYTRKKYPDNSIFLLGHSMGGLCVLSYGLKSQQKIRGIIASSPLLDFSVKVPKPLEFIANLLSSFYPNLRLESKIQPEFLSHNKERVQGYKDDPLVFSKITVGWFRAICKAAKETINHGKNYRIPLYIHQAGEDRLVSPETTRIFYDSLELDDREFEFYPDLYHEILNEDCKFDIMEKMEAWISKRTTE